MNAKPLHRKQLGGVLCALALCSLLPSTRAVVLLGNLPSNDGTYFSWGHLAVPFTLPAGPAYIVNSVDLRLSPSGQATLPSFEFRDDPGTGDPGAGIVGSLTTPPKISDSPETYSYAASGLIVLQPSTTYWLFGDLRWPLFWYASDPSVPATGVATAGDAQHDVGGGWNDWGPMPSFQINATAVPEPSSGLAASLFCGAMCLASLRRRRTA